jgi:YHS domain-containing protein
MRLLLRLGAVLVVLLAAMSILRGILSSSQSGSADAGPDRGPRSSGATTGKLVRDPVCGTYIPASGSLSVRSGDETLCFCSEACRDSFVGRAPAS